jgi:hypothetical protein
LSNQNTEVESSFSRSGRGQQRFPAELAATD